MTNITYKLAWERKFKKEFASIQEYWETSPFDNWRQSQQPWYRVSLHLLCGLEILYADIDSSLGWNFIKRALQIIERSEQDRKLAIHQNEIDYPLQCAEVFTLKSHLKSLLHNTTDDALLNEAANCYLKWIRPKSTALWHDQDQYYFLSAVRAALISGNCEHASEYFEGTTNVRWCHFEADDWYDLHHEWLQSKEISSSTAQRIWHHFDEVRSPDYHPEAHCRIAPLRLEYGAIIYKYLLNQGGDIDWKEVIKLISR